MTVSLKHSFTSPKADGTDATLVQPSNWNAEHTITLAAGKVLGRDASGAGAVQELPLSFDATGQSMVPPSGTTAQRPATATAGMLRYNTTTSKFELYNGTAWGSVGGGASISDTAPSNPQPGDLWWKSDEGQMYVYYTDANSSQWVVANAFSGGPGYLPLAGGTLTGSLTGTDATFSGTVAMGSSFKRNRIINGNMLIDQRNAGASVTVNNSSNNTFSVDRWQGAGETTDGVYTLQQSSVAPTGFTNSMLATVTAADTSIGATQRYFVQQRIEGYNTADFGWGAAGALSITLSFWVRSSLTGTFGGSIRNSAGDRSYPFSYTISAANTWEQKSVTIAGDTTGTWVTNSGVGMFVTWGLGVGSSLSGTAGAWAASGLWSATGAVNVIATNGATFYLTGVQLEVGTKATPYEMQIYSDQLAQCQRYYFQPTAGSSPAQYAAINTNQYAGSNLPVSMRTSPTMTFPGLAGGTQSALTVSPNSFYFYYTTTSGYSVTASAEL